MWKRTIMLLWLLCMCLLTCCGQASSEREGKKNIQDIGEITVASNMGTRNAFDGNGYYHLGYTEVVYIDAEHQAEKMKKVYGISSSEYLMYTMYHQGFPYLLSSDTGASGGRALSTWYIRKWDPTRKKLMSVAEETGEDVVINSMAMAGSMLYYTTSILKGTVFVGGESKAIQDCQFWSVDTDSGEKKLLHTFEGSETQLLGALTIVDGDYEDPNMLLVKYTYILYHDDDQEEFTDFYELDLHTQGFTQMEDLQIGYYIDMGYLYGNEFYYMNGEAEYRFNYNYMNMDTGEIKTVLTSNYIGLLLPEYISFSTDGNDPRNYLYSYKDGTLLVSKKDVAHSPYIVGIGEDSVATDETDYSTVTDYQEDPGVYRIADKETFIQDNFTKYAGESADVLTFYGRDGKGAAEAVTTEVD